MFERNVTTICALFIGFMSGAVFFVSGDKGGFQSSPAWAVTESCANPDCACKDCKCDPCECPCDVKAEDARPIIYFFTMGEACQPCIEMKPVVDKMKADGHRIVTMDIQEPKNKKYVDYYNAYTVPVFVTVDQNGYEIRRTEAGLSTPDAILGKVSLQDTSSVKSSGPVLYTTSSCSSGSCGSYSTSYRTSRPRWFLARS